ncbi:MAG: F0F1 ATP synthase subunit A [Planctomycetaceae bacterium]
MNLSPDETVFWQIGFLKLNATVVFTWLVMTLMTIVSWFITRRFVARPCSGDSIGRLGDNVSLLPSRGQTWLEMLVELLRKQIRDVSQQEPGPYLPFVGTLFLFIAVSNLLIIIPSALYQPPTGSLSTAAALATCVFIAVPVYGIRKRGVRAYLGNYIRPNVLMLPFNLIGEVSRTLALAVRLYGNMMSGAVLLAILVGFVPLFVPVAIELFGLLTGMIQAYIFAILAMVYIASATRVTRSQKAVADNTDTKILSTGVTS